ncbi:MAG: energy-coupled thiamine transporter ThiT [Ruminococcus sp.]|nr:energy-coupled thiamine transporter ThiT [Ruminococcus sp.]
MKNVSKKTLRLVTSGVLIGLATVLSMIKVFSWPFGGSVTLFSMVPILVLGYMYGVRWGLLCGGVYGVLQMILGATMSQAFAGLSGWAILVMALLDYIVAYVVVGLCGMFKGKIKNDTVAFSLGAVVAILIRLFCHFLSGWIFWGSYAEWFFGEAFVNSFSSFVMSNFSGQALAALYSIIYNSLYMIPELIISVIGIIALMAVKPLRERIANGNKAF